MSEPAPKPAEKDSADRKVMREGVLRMALTSEARQRLANVKMVKPELAASIEEYIIRLATGGQIKRPVDDEQLKQMLISVQGTKREIKIRRL